MNILVLNYEFPPIGGGGSSVSYDISKRLAERGHSIYVVTMKYGNLSVDEDIDGMHVHRVKCLRKRAFVCHPWEQFTYIFSAIIYANIFLKNHKIDVIHAHFIIPTGVVAWYIKKRYGINYILTAHGSDVVGHNNKRFGFLYKLIMSPWKKIVKDSMYTVALSDHLKKLICKNMASQYAENRVKVIHNGLDTSIYYATKKEKIILLMGRIQETKGMQDVLNCMSPELLGDWRIKIVGDGPYRSELEKAVSNNHLEKNVDFCGWIEAKSPEQLEILAKAAVFISASHVENCPMTPVEAYCSGCKVVLSDIPGHREVLGNKAIYFSLENKSALLSIVHDVIAEFESCSENEVFSSNNLICTGEEFDWEKRVDFYEKYLLESVK